MNRILLESIFFALALGALGKSPKLKKCESSIGNVKKAIVTGSQFENERYILRTGTDVGIEVTFSTEKEINDLQAFASIILRGMEFSLPLPNLNGCKMLNCPLQKGGPYFYKVTMPVLDFYPKIKTIAKLRLKNEDSEVIACIEVPIKVV